MRFVGRVFEEDCPNYPDEFGQHKIDGPQETQKVAR